MGSLERFKFLSYRPIFVTMKHNNAIPRNHFKKDWQNRVKTWFDQPARKQRRRVNRAKKAARVFPRPVAGLLRPLVQAPTKKYNAKTRLGRGFTLEELKAAGVSRYQARSIGIAVDHRRKTARKKACSATPTASPSTRTNWFCSRAKLAKPRKARLSTTRAKKSSKASHSSPAPTCCRCRPPRPPSSSAPSPTRRRTNLRLPLCVANATGSKRSVCAKSSPRNVPKPRKRPKRTRKKAKRAKERNKRVGFFDC